MDTPPPRVSTTRLDGPGRGPAVFVLLALALVGGGIVSAAVAGGSAASPRPAAPTAQAAPTAFAATVRTSPPGADPSLRPGEMACVPAGWRLAYTGSMAAMPVETWLVVAPGEASGPLDRGIPVSYLGHDTIVGLGACAPPVGQGDVGRPALIERAWRLAGTGGAVSATPIGMVALDGAAPVRVAQPSALELVRPADGARRGWSAGSYVLELEAPASAGGTASASPAWIRIELDPPAS